tara:strand:- start:1890 stop:2111 length:222 start_codon:yes stop_codon:yes gene_type:complete
MQFDKGNTIFDLQATTFTDKYELFDKIKDSHTPKYNTVEILQRYQNAGLIPTGKDIMREMWEQEDISSTHKQD